MRLKEIYKPIEEELERVEARLAEGLNDGSALGSHLLKMKGKRLRPALVLLSSKLGRAKLSQAIDLATAVELIHTASLVHDDVIDDAKVRRRRPSLNMKFGKNAAILFGDYLYSKAFEIISALNNPRVTTALLRATNAICQGEMQQLFRVFQTLREKEYLKIIADKTASLFSACCEAGGIISGANSRQISNLRKYGHNLGMIFQVTDDCLDVIGDEREGKMTLPLIYLNRYSGRSKTEAVAYALTVADNYKTQALKAANSFPTPKPFKNLAEFVLNRLN